MKDIKPVEKDLFEPLWKAVYRQLFDDIVKLKLEPNHKLSEAQLATAMDVSRSPVKMALDKLCEDGLVSKLPNSGYLVLGMSPDECIDLCDARIGLESQAAYLAAKRITNEELDQMKNIITEFQRIEREKDYAAYPQADLSFHRIMVNATRNDLIINMHATIASDIQRYHYLGVKIHSIENANIIAHHVAIYTALRNHQSNTAREEVVSDINNMKIAAGFLLQEK